jgi:hypothetical protein
MRQQKRDAHPDTLQNKVYLPDHFFRIISHTVNLFLECSKGIYILFRNSVPVKPGCAASRRPPVNRLGMKQRIFHGGTQQTTVP